MLVTAALNRHFHKNAMFCVFSRYPYESGTECPSSCSNCTQRIIRNQRRTFIKTHRMKLTPQCYLLRRNKIAFNHGWNHCIGTLAACLRKRKEVRICFIFVNSQTDRGEHLKFVYQIETNSLAETISYPNFVSLERLDKVALQINASKQAGCLLKTNKILLVKRKEKDSSSFLLRKLYFEDYFHNDLIDNIKLSATLPQCRDITIGDEIN